MALVFRTLHSIHTLVKFVKASDLSAGLTSDDLLRESIECTRSFHFLSMHWYKTTYLFINIGNNVNIRE